MIDPNHFYRALGADSAPAPHEHLILPSGTRVQATEQGWVALFEGRSADLSHMQLLMDFARHSASLVAFSSSSGVLGMNWRCLDPGSTATQAAQVLLALEEQMGS